MSNAYAVMQQRHQKEFDQFPLGAAFSKKQFREMMEEWGLTETDTDKILSIGAGCFIRKSDKEAYHEMVVRQNTELDAAIAEDKTGEGFIYQMFLYELANHEYGYTLDMDSTLNALGYTPEAINADERLLNGLSKAARKIRGSEF